MSKLKTKHKAKKLKVRKNQNLLNRLPLLKSNKLLKSVGILVILLITVAVILTLQQENKTKKPTLTSLQTQVSKVSLPQKDPSIKKVIQKEKGYVLTAAEKGNIDKPISFAAKGGEVSFTSIPNENLGGLNPSDMEKTKDGKTIYKNIYNGIDLIYTPSANGILEEYEVKVKRKLTNIIQKIDITGLTHKTQKDGSIIFYNKNNEFAFAVPKPVMYEKFDTTNKNYGLHYEIFTYKGNTFLAKVIDSNGQEWLNKSNYPVMIDATILLTLFSYQSYPTVDDSWQVSIETVGSGDLKIKPAEETTWDDLSINSISCGENKVEYDSSAEEILIPNYSCDQNTIVTTKVKDTLKQHALEFSWSGYSTVISSTIYNGKPLILSSSLNPAVVKVGDTITVKAEVADKTGVKNVSANMGGVQTINLDLISGTDKKGIWEGKWKVAGTATKPYETIIKASNGTQSISSSIGFFDPYTCTGGGDHAGADWNPATDCAGGLFAGEHTNIGTLNVSNGETATVQTFDQVNQYGIATISASTVTIAGTMTANGKGWAGGAFYGTGPGGGTWVSGASGSGGGYGGTGRTTANGILGGPSYGSLATPGDLGSGGGSNGGGSGGAGGGSVRINTTGTLTVSGTISSNGGNATGGEGGGGSGGSIYLSAANFAGNGSITANGGTYGGGSGGGGGGGRIAIYYTNTNTYSGTPTVTVGTGGATIQQKFYGTAFIKKTTTGDILIPSNNGAWKGNDDMPSWSFNNLTINGSIVFQATQAALFTITSTGSTTFASGITITANGSYTTNSNGVGVYFNLTGDVTIPATTTISADEQGYLGVSGANGAGPGGGLCGCSANSGSGGGYGGTGKTSSNNNPGGPSFGSLATPEDLGSSGGGASSGRTGGAGGGAIRINTTGTLTVSGSITANGGTPTSSESGGGSGGSIYLSAGSIAGSGTISANGGNATNSGGGGGGGRIAMYYTSSNTYSGTPTISLGTGGTGGVIGTAFIKSSSTGDLLIPVANGIWKGDDDLSPWTFGNLTINANITFQATNAATFTLVSTGSATFASGITITANGSYTTNSNGVGVYFNLTGDVTIPATTTITANAKGYPGVVSGAGLGPGGGGYSASAGGGGGGYGSNGSTGTAAGGSSYGSLTAPVDLGSGGGANGPFLGGAGGGAIRITTTGTLTVSGSVIANGENGTSNHAAGGSGGSIYLTTGSLAGNGTITANGGNASGGGGGGSGGRVAIYYNSSNNWAGNSLTAAGAAVLGTGGTGGGNGTVNLDQDDVPLISNLLQYQSDCTTSVSVGGTLQGNSSGSTGCFKATLDTANASDTLYLQVNSEVIGTTFTNVGSQSAGFAYSGTPVVGSVLVAGHVLGTNYHWQARAVNIKGSASSWVSFGGNAESASDFYANVPPPANVTSEYNSDTQITIVWENSALNVVNFEIQRSENGGAYSTIGTTANGATLTFVDNASNNPSDPPSANNSYQYKVRSNFSGYSSDYSNPSSLVYTTPAAPSAVTLAQTSVGSITINWTNNANYQSNFEIQRKIGSGSYATITSSVSSAATSYTDSNVQEGATYIYKVAALRTTPDALTSAYAEAGSSVNITEGFGKGIYLTQNGTLIVQNDFNESVDIFNNVFNDSTDQVGQDLAYDSSTPASCPNLPTGSTINDLTVKEGVSSVDGKSNVIYVGTSNGLVAIHENSADPATGGVKYYTSSYISEIMYGDVRGMWTLDASASGGLADVSNKSQTLTNNGTTTFTDGGVRGTSASLNGSTKYLSIADNANLSITGDLSLGAWFKTPSPTTAQTIVAKNGSYTLGINSSGNLTASVIGNTTGTVTGSTVLNSSWHEAVMVYNASSQTLTLYLDGKVEASTTSSVPSAITNSTGQFNIGANNGATFFGGNIDEAFVTATAITAGEVTAMNLSGLRALQNHPGNIISGVAVNNYQRLLGNGAGSSTVNNVGAVAVDEGNQFVYIGTNDTSANTGGTVAIGVHSDSVADLYASSNALQEDDQGNLFSSNDAIAISLTGIPNPGYNTNSDYSQNGGVVAIAGTNDSTSRLFIKNQSYSLTQMLSTGGSGGGSKSTFNVSNLFTVGNVLGITSSTSGELLQIPAFQIDQDGVVQQNYLGTDGTTNALTFNGSGITTGNVLSITSPNLTTGNSLSVVNSGSGGNAIKAQSLGTGLTNIALYASASGATNNYAALFASGSVGIGTLTPAVLLDVSGSQSSSVSAMITNTNTSTSSGVLALKLGVTTPATSNYYLSFLNGSGSIVGKIQGNGSGGVSFATNGIDFAEYYKKADASESFEAGDIVCLSELGGVTKCSNSAQSILGIVSDRAGFIGGGNHEGDDSYILVGIIGQLDVRVSSLSGNINPADPLTVSQDGGVIKAVNSGNILGHALEKYDTSTDSTKIRISINVSWYDPNPSVVSASSSGGLSSDLYSRLDILSSAVNTLQNAFLMNASSSSFLDLATNADLNSPVISADLIKVKDLNVSDNLTVQGRTTVNDLGVTGKINSGLLIINGLDDSVGEGSGATINTLTGDLYLQNRGLGGVDILAGKVTIDKDGNVNIKEVLSAKTIKSEQFTVKGKGTIGSATLPKGKTSIEIETTSMQVNSKVFVTPTSLTDLPLVVVSKAKGSFIVEIKEPQGEEITFDWWIVGNE